MRNSSAPRVPIFRAVFANLLLALGLILSACEMVPPPQPTQAPTPSVHLRPGVTGIAMAAPTSAPAATAGTTPSRASSPSPAVNATAFPDPAGYQWATVASGLDKPLGIENAGDGSGRLFVVEKPGRIVILQNGQALPTPFLDIADRVKSSGSEQGLLGLAFHPNYSQTGLFYVNYIDLNGNTVVASFHVSANDPNQADPASEQDLLHVDQPYPNHNGGSTAFGPDGYLYVGLGDGGSEGDPQRNGQNLQTMLGKILRIDVNNSHPYAIPKDNPFAQGGGLPEIWAYGLRNPWRISFDKATGDMFIADVGQDSWEEVDFVAAGTPGGLNFGWSYFEGMHPFHDQPPANASFVQPVAEYSHAEGCSISGGYVYRGRSMPAWTGIYFYGDYCSGNVWGLLHTSGTTWQSQKLFSTDAKISSFGVDEAGELYLADLDGGRILRLGPKQ